MTQPLQQRGSLRWAYLQHVQAHMRYRAIKGQPVQSVRSDVVPLLAQRLYACYRVAALAITLQLFAGCGAGCEPCKDAQILKAYGTSWGHCCGAGHKLTSC